MPNNYTCLACNIQVGYSFTLPFSEVELRPVDEALSVILRYRGFGARYDSKNGKSSTRVWFRDTRTRTVDRVAATLICGGGSYRICRIQVENSVYAGVTEMLKKSRLLGSDDPDTSSIDVL